MVQLHANHLNQKRDLADNAAFKYFLRFSSFFFFANYMPCFESIVIGNFSQLSSLIGRYAFWDLQRYVGVVRFIQV